MPGLRCCLVPVPVGGRCNLEGSRISVQGHRSAETGGVVTCRRKFGSKRLESGQSGCHTVVEVPATVTPDEILQ